MHKIILDETEKKPEAKKPKLESSMLNFIEKPDIGALLSESACLGASYKFLTKDKLIRKGLESLGFPQPKTVTTISNHIHKFADQKSFEVTKKVLAALSKGKRFSTSLDEYTCPIKRKRYLGV